MRAFVSGEAGAAIMVGTSPAIRSIYGTVAKPWHAGDALRLFDGCSDVRTVDVPNVGEADRECKLAWAQDRGLRLFLFLLDPEEPKEELVEYAECISELLEEHPILLHMQRRLAAAPLPAIDKDRIAAACAHVQEVYSLFQWLLNVQADVVRVRAEFDTASVAENAAALRERMTVDGSFLDVVTALAAKNDLSFIQLQLISRHRHHSPMIAKWFKALQGDIKRISKAVIRAQKPEAIEVEISDRTEVRQPSYAAYHNVMVQQKAITARLKDHDIGQARRLMNDLVASQRANSTPEQLAKSLSNMARQAGNFDIPGLALEWSREATIANPHDPIAYGHLANALLNIGLHDEAEAALNEVEKKGDPLYAATGRARILRNQGKIEEAREAFISAAEAFDDHEDSVHARLGAAEALRELGDSNGAWSEYQKLSIDFPLEINVWIGLASTLVDLGNVEEALKTYSRAASYDSVKGRLGRAHALRAFGNISGALEIFDEVLEEHPTNSFAFCGRGDVLQDQGKFGLALAVYEKAIFLSPHRAEPILGKIRVLRHMEKYQDALDILGQVNNQFPYEKRFEIALILIYRAQGRFTDALVACDRMNNRFPFDIHIQLARAAVLTRLGSVVEAMDIYDSILNDKPRFRRAMLGKAAILIRTGRKEEAARLLPTENPTSRGDWRAINLRIMLLEERDGPEAASEMLSELIPQCPFAAERRRMRDLLAIIELRLRRWPQVRRMVEAHLEEVSNVISLHVFAATHRTLKAREWLARIRAEDGPADVINLAEEIARRHQLTDESPQQPPGWIEETERTILLAEAA